MKNNVQIYKQEKLNEITKFLESQNIKFKNFDLYIEAFTHGSFFMGKKMGINYQRLEFLGDSVLATVTSKFLYYNYEISEGEMTKLRAKMVCKPTLASFSRQLKLEDVIIIHENMPKSEINTKILGDTLESFLGAFFIDQGYEEVEKFLLKNFFPQVLAIIEEIDVEDYKTKLQEILQTKSAKILQYNIINRKNNKKSNSVVFTVGVYYDGNELGRGQDTSRKKAEQKAALDALNKLSNDEEMKIVLS
ncbi:hypothetical protein ASO20_00680 [Mycoplasma sp. (ex Biomphalaria glabrata)]|uniref:ribonuclease III n=1 Tax=Mycoplasma sp. (ex Biomphalaria glabrata) TaxID=1749074 RepID=UPI00073A6375|nr:ribonuclease III [Mycoplasma sp. (ex Biomphalaria glabrata)]ALV23191.1 hypothetical protein ASO20_00680 [Mycoplasma sp. (ex Biomphalaria glabrata)]